MVTIAVIGMGEMGSGIAGRLVANGAGVVTSLEGRSAASAERAQKAGVDVVNDRELVAAAEIILSVVPPATASATAARFLPLIEAADRNPTFIDCNAIAPQTLESIAEPFLRRGLPFGDGSIIGLPPRPDGYTPRLYLSGAVTREAAALRALGLNTIVLSDRLGEASTLKMAFAGVTKGCQAIGVAMALGAARHGVSDGFIAELRGSAPEIYGWLQKTLPILPAKAYRWDGEMREIAKFLEPERGAADMLLGAATLYEHVAEDNRVGPSSEILSVLGGFVKPAV